MTGSSVKDLGMNPFSNDPDRHALWEMLVKRDIEAFVEQDWNLVADDFIEPGFIGLDARLRADPDSWRLGFPALGSYRESWLEQARTNTGRISPDALAEALHDATTLRDIDLNGETAVAHKKFDGSVRFDDGTVQTLRWQTLYFCRKVEGTWKISGFVGYLPNPLNDTVRTGPVKEAPAGSSQHATAGPYSPVLRVRADELVVISGQVAVLPDGRVSSTGFTQQSEDTLNNCLKQLESAGLGFADVFKVNVYLADLADWGAFNEVYRRMVPDPKPVRTAVGVALLPGFLVEVEMWAAR